MERAGTWARPLSLIAALALMVGVILTGLNLLLWGWTVYAVGHVAAILAFIAVSAASRERFDPWTWLALLVLVLGLVLALPQIVAIWQAYAAPSPGRDMELPVWTPPLGLTAELVTWVGVAFFGLAARGVHALPKGIGWVMVGAAVIGIIAALYIVSPYAWVGAMLLLAMSVMAIGVSRRANALG